FLEAGGPVVKILLAVAVVMWWMILERALFYRRELPSLVAGAIAQWEARTDKSSWYAEKQRRRVLAETERRIRGPLPAIRAFVAVCPLLGLLGTVTGMIQVFEVMAVLGTGNAREMAAGVSASTLPTLARSEEHTSELQSREKLVC